MDLNAGGEISASKIGTTPHALQKQRVVRTGTFIRARLHDLPLNAKLDTESTSGKLAERVRDDPEWDEHSDEEDEDAGKKGNQIKFGRRLFACSGTHITVRRRPMY